MAKSRGGGGPGSPGSARSLAGTRESLAAEPGADELSSLGSDSEVNGGGADERRVDKFGFLVGSRSAEGPLEEVPLEVLRQRESKWLDMLNNWDKWMAKKHKKEGFSLIDSHKWLKIVRRADCLLFGAKSKPNECRMFRVQFGGDSKEQMLEHCSHCVQKLAEYLPVQAADEQSQMLYPSLHQLANNENQVKNYEQNAAMLHTTDQPLTDSGTSFGERRSITQLAQSVLKSKAELALVDQHSVWSAQELGPFIRLCLMDQNFPAFVEDVEKELKKLTEG